MIPVMLMKTPVKFMINKINFIVTVDYVFIEKINALQRINSYLILGDFNAKFGNNQHENWPETVSKYGLGKTSDRRSQLLQLVITNTLFRHLPKRHATWISPDHSS